MSTAPALAIDRVDRIDPRVREQPERRQRPGRPFPEIDEDGTRDQRKPSDAPVPPHPPLSSEEEDDDGDTHTIDVRVRGRLPTRQILPGCAGAALAS
jgi:hypothetical protein